MRKNDINSNYAILSSQTIEGKKPLTLTELRERYECEHNDPTLFDLDAGCVVCGIGA